MGLIPKCLPDEVLNEFLKFKELFVQPIPEFEYLLQVSMLFKIPWIMSWTYNYQEIHLSTKAKTEEIEDAPLPDPELVARILNATGSSHEELHRLLQDIHRSLTESNESTPTTQLLQDAQDLFDDPYKE